MNLQGNKHYYRVYGLEIESDIEIKELVAIDSLNDDTRVTITRREMPEEIRKSKESGKHNYFSYKEVWFEVKDVATYRVINGNTIEYEPYKNADEYYLRVFLTCSCLGFLMIQRDTIAIHGGTIVIDNKAVIITGERGAGKSTLTTALRIKGYPFISDDVAALEVGEEVKVMPGFPYQKLCLSAMNNFGYDPAEYFSFMSDKEVKYVVPAKEHFIDVKTKLYAICQLRAAEVEQVVIEEVKGREKLQLIMENRYRSEFVQYFGGITPKAFKSTVDIAKGIKVYKITRPIEGFSVDEEIRLIEEKINDFQLV